MDGAGEENNNYIVPEPADSSSIYTLDMSSLQMTEIPNKMDQYKNCKSLSLSCNNISAIKENNLSSLTQLKELKLYSNSLKTISGLQQLGKLEELQLQYNFIKTVEKSLKNNRNLLFLRLDSNRLSSISASELCSLSKLIYLDISSNKLDNINCVNTLPSLERLFCTHNSLSKLPSLSVLKRLKEVDFSCNSLVDLSGLKGCNKLEIIVVDKNRIKNVASISNLKSLQELKISCNLISDLKSISELSNSLEVLEISNNKIGHFDQIKCLFKITSLRELYINGNPLLSDGEMKSKVISVLRNNLQLQIIDGVEVNNNNNASVAGTTPRPMSASGFRPMSASGIRSFTNTPVMRPMSASHMISERSINDQMEFSILQMKEIEDKIKLQYDVVKDSLMQLPQSQLVNTNNNTAKKMNIRPSSRCSSRSRLKEAKAFADKHFHS